MESQFTLGAERRFSVGAILSGTFSIFFSNLVAFGILCGAILSPVIWLQTVAVKAQVEGEGPDPTINLLVMACGLLLGPIATAALTYGVVQELHGRRSGLAECLVNGVKRLFPVLGVSIMVGLALMGGMILCIVPGLIVLAMLAAAVPVAVIERPGVRASLTRSMVLTKGFRLRVLGIVLIFSGVGFVLNMLAGVFAALAAWLLIPALAAASILSTGLSATASSLIYYHLRRHKEGIDAEEIAAVFD